MKINEDTEEQTQQISRLSRSDMTDEPATTKVFYYITILILENELVDFLDIACWLRKIVKTDQTVVSFK